MINPARLVIVSRWQSSIFRAGVQWPLLAWRHMAWASVPQACMSPCPWPSPEPAPRQLGPQPDARNNRQTSVQFWYNFHT